MPKKPVFTFAISVLFCLLSACTGSRSSATKKVDADGFFGIKRKTYYHVENSTSAKALDFKENASNGSLYQYKTDSGLTFLKEISSENVKTSLDGKVITINGSPEIFEQGLVLDQLKPERVSEIQPKLETLCHTPSLAYDFRFNVDGSFNTVDASGQKTNVSSYTKTETGFETTLTIVGQGSFRILLSEPHPTDTQFFHTTSQSNAWASLSDLYCHQNRSTPALASHTIFATRDLFHGIAGYPDSVGSIANADSLCNTAARASSKTSGMPGVWRAILSDATTNAKDRIHLQTGAGVRNVNDDLIADSQTALWSGTIQNPVGYDEHGVSFDATVYDVWTGSLPNGTSGTLGGVSSQTSTCEGWTSTVDDDEAYFGNVSMTSTWLFDPWTVGKRRWCDKTKRLYCINSVN